MNDFKRLSIKQNELLIYILSQYGSVLTEWEYNFIDTIVKFKMMSSKQKVVLTNIVKSFDKQEPFN
jgi:hypothetical protein